MVLITCMLQSEAYVIGMEPASWLTVATRYEITQPMAYCLSKSAVMRRPARTCQSRPDVVAHVVSRAAHLGGVVEREGAVHVGRPRVGAALHQNVQRLHLAAYCNRKITRGVTQSSIASYPSRKVGHCVWLNSIL